MEIILDQTVLIEENNKASAEFCIYGWLEAYLRNSESQGARVLFVTFNQTYSHYQQIMKKMVIPFIII